MSLLASTILFPHHSSFSWKPSVNGMLIPGGEISAVTQLAVHEILAPHGFTLMTRAMLATLRDLFFKTPIINLVCATTAAIRSGEEVPLRFSGSNVISANASQAELFPSGSGIRRRMIPVAITPQTDTRAANFEACAEFRPEMGNCAHENNIGTFMELLVPADLRQNFYLRARRNLTLDDPNYDMHRRFSLSLNIIK